MKKMKRLLALLLVLAMALTLLPTTVLATGAETERAATEATRPQAIESPLAGYTQALQDNRPATATEGTVEVQKISDIGTDLKQAAQGQDNLATEAEAIAPETLVKVIVVLEEQSLLQRGFTTAQIAEASATQTALRSIARTQDAVLADIRGAVGGEAQEKYRYNVVISGLSLVVPYGSLASIREIEGVKTAFVAPSYAVPEDMTQADAEPNMDSASGLSGATRTWETLGYSGEGMRIAIVDTGLDVDHPSFTDAPTLTEDSLRLEELEAVLTDLNAYEIYGGELSADDLYYNEKVPFGFNYVDMSLDVTHDRDTMGDHGSHVAGIAAANDIESSEVVGMAPEAQLLVMKVFGLNGGAYFDDILAALEDSFRLNADAVNLSLGSPGGFSSESDVTDEIFSVILESDMIVTISAGNETSFSHGNAYGTEMNFASDPDVGLVGSPGTYLGATTVASMENELFRLNYLTVGEDKVGYNDVGLYPIAMNYGGKTLEYVMVPGIGDVSDYENVDVTDKVAVVVRGGLDFTAKQTNAYNAGAAVCIVYDNTDGELINMMDAELLPNAFITKADGAILAAAAGEDGVGTLTVGGINDMIPVDSPLAGRMSSFSSVGVTPDLKLEPDITAYGGNIYSCFNDGTYGMMSGTSMSAPAVSGMSALVLQYLRQEHDELTDAQKHTIAEALLMSTATAVIDPDNATVHYSPRKQGAGNANIYNAIVSPAYLTVDGASPKVSMGDDDARSGEYTFTFEVNNFSDRELVYRLDGYVMTDQINLDYADQGYLFMSETGRKLGGALHFSTTETTLEPVYDLNGDKTVNLEDVALLLDMVNGVTEISQQAAAFDLNADGLLDTVDAQRLYELVRDNTTQVQTLTVPAGETITITTTVTLTDEDKAYMDTYYENGIYVEGFVTLTAVSEGAVDLSLPYMGFYGDWSDARMFDSGWWYQPDSELKYMRYPHVVFTQFGGSDHGYNLGLNPYLVEDYDPWHNVLSANDDGYADYIGEIYLSLMRNARKLDFIWDIYDENGDFVESIVETADYARKSFYYSFAGMCIPFMYADYFENASEITAGLPDGYRVELSIEGYLDDGDEIMDERLTLPVEGGLSSIPIYIDNYAPVIVDEDIDCWYNEEDDARRIEFYVQDNHAIAAVATLTEAGKIIEMLPVEDSDGPVHISIDVTGYDSSFLIAVCDYGANESYYSVDFAGKYSADFDSFYGYRTVAEVPSGDDYSYSTDTLNGWYSFKTADVMLQHSSQYDSGETPVAAAEYVDGYILGVDVEGRIFAMKSGQWTRAQLGTLEVWDETCSAVDMAFDHTEKVMYILTDEYSLVRMDYLTGEYEVLGYIYDSNWDDDYDFNYGLTLACDNDGILYTIDAYSGDLFTIDPVECTATHVGSTGYWPWGEQSMTVDHETNELYWIANEGGYGDNNFYRVDKTTGELTWLADVEYNSAITGLFKPYASPEPLFPTGTQVHALQLSETELLLAEGLTAELLCKQLPYYADALDVTWSSSDESVVQVYEGQILAVGAGEAVITVSSGELSASCHVEVFAFTDRLYAYDMGTTGLWVEFPAASPADIITYDDAVPSNAGFTAAAYHDGWVYASEYDGGFYRLDPTTLQGSKIGSTGSALMGMAFNYTDGFMYGVRMTTGEYGDQSFHLVRVNLMNGDVQVIQELDKDTYGTVLCSLAIDPQGNFYLLGTDYWSNRTQLLQCALTDADYLEILDVADLSRYPTYGFGALHYSFSNGGLYWTTDEAHLMWVDLADMPQLRAVDLGVVGYESSWPQILGVYTIPETEPEAPVVAPERVTLPESYLLPEGGSTGSNLSVEPWNATVEASYSIADPSVATVDASGVITGVSVGTTALTVVIESMNYSKTVEVNVVASTGNVYGYLISDFVSNGDVWVHVSDVEPSVLTAEAFGDTSLSIHAGTWYDGDIYGVAQDQDPSSGQRYFVRVDGSDHSLTRLAEVNANVRDMAFDYTTGTLYGIAEGGLLAGAVVQFNTQTGAMTQIADTGMTIAAMTIDTDGQMYAVCQTDDCLYAIDKHTGQATRIGSTGADAGALYQSMAYDPETGNLYWAQAADNKTSALRLVSTTTGMSAVLGPVGTYGALLSCLHTERSNEPETPTTVEPNGIMLTEKAFVVTGQTLALSATVLPVSVAEVDQTLTWSSSDPAVATVDNGVVTGVAAGTATVTATNANGDSATCEITVSDTDRAFFAYDRTNSQWIRFSGDDTANVTVMRADAEGEVPLLAAAYTGSVLYAYDANGEFYTVDSSSFQRTRVGSGINGQTIDVESVSWSGDTYTMTCTLEIIDLSWDAQSAKLYAALRALDEDGWSAGIVLAEVDTASGQVTPLFHSEDEQPGNLLVLGGKAFFADSYSGMLLMVDLGAEEKTCVSLAQIPGYWGEYRTSRSFIMDDYTGTVYVVRDMTDTWEDNWEETQHGQAILYTMDLSTGSLTPTTANEAYIGNGIMVCGLFLK